MGSSSLYPGQIRTTVRRAARGCAVATLTIAALAVVEPAASGFGPQPPPPRRSALATGAPMRMPPALAVDEPFDHSVTRLPAQFVGHDIGAVITALAPKGEFETTAEYRARIGALMRPTTMFAFPLADEAFDARYDADAGSFAIKVIEESRVRADPPMANVPPAIAVRRTVSRSDYDWATPSGGRASVRRVEGDLHAVIPIESSQQGASRLGIAAGVPRETAPLVKPRLGVLLVCTIPDVERPTAHGANAGRPTVDNPVDHSWRFHYLQVRPHSWWVYDRGTGEVFVRAIERP